MTELDRKLPCWAVVCGSGLRDALDRQELRDWQIIGTPPGENGDLSVFRGHASAWCLVSLDDAAVTEFLRSPKALLRWTVQVDSSRAALLLLTVGPESAPWRRVVGFGLSTDFALAAPEIPRSSGGLVADLIAHVGSLHAQTIELNSEIGLVPMGGVPVEVPRGVVSGYRAGPVEPSIVGRTVARAAAHEIVTLPKKMAYCHGNEFYGHGEILRGYCGVSGLPIRGRVQHGWFPRDRILCDDLDLIAPSYVWNEGVRATALAIMPESHTIGAPYLYLPSVADPGPIGTGVLIAPTHSLRVATVTGSWTDYAAGMRQWAERHGFSFATAILGHREFEHPEVESAFASVGIPCVSAGTPGSKDFLYRVRYYIRAHAAVVSDRLSTILFYGLHEGRGAHVAGPEMPLDEPDFSDELVTDPRWIAANYPGMAEGGLAGLAEARADLGVGHRRSSSELRALLFGWLLGREAA